MRDWREEIQQDAWRERLMEILCLFGLIVAGVALWEAGWRLGSFGLIFLLLLVLNGLYKALRWWERRP